MTCATLALDNEHITTAYTNILQHLFTTAPHIYVGDC